MRLPGLRFRSISLVSLMFAAMASGPGGRATALGADQAADAARVEKLKQDYSDGAAVRSRLVVLRQGKGKDAQPIVVLRRPVATRDIPEHSGPTRHDLMVREMSRQAVLIAARDELGLVTRDEVIGECPTGFVFDQGGEDIEVVSFIRDHQSRERIYRVVDGRVEPIFSSDTPGGGPRPDLDRVQLLIAAEAESRRDFPKVLRGLGLEGKPNVLKEQTKPELLKTIEGQFEKLGFSQTLEALRTLHRAMRIDGETPAVVGALARGYAQLGVLSEYQWHPAHKVFKARALLYAQRLAARDPKRPWGLWHRAFALALVGLHGAALADLDAAKTLAGSADKVPAWLDLVDAAARYDVRRLAGHRGPHKNLAALLRMIALEFPESRAIALRSAREVVPLSPLCFRALDSMCQYRGVSSLHVATEIGPQILEQVFAADLLSLKTVPAIVKNRLAGPTGLVELEEAIDKAAAPGADEGEPSWGVLAHLLREARFVQVWRRLEFMKVMWGVPVDDYWNQVRDDVAAHRYFPFLETFALPQREARAKLVELVDRIDLTDIEKTSHDMNRYFWGTGRPRGKAAWEMAWAHLNLTARERAFAQWTEELKYHANASREILRVSPYNPYARMTLIEQDWDKVKDDLKTWEKEAGDVPVVIGSIGWQLSRQEKYEEARPALMRYIELSPDLWAYQRLAENYKAQGKIDRWQETLDEFLNKVEDLGLDHANVRIEIADYYMGRKQWDKATPYAEEAAQSWSESSMQSAARCAEGMENWERAEAWHRQITERYDQYSWADWYYFCKRTGRGDLKAAREFVDQVFADRAKRGDPVGEEDAGYFYMLDDRTDKARALLEKARADRGSFVATCGLALIADDAKDAGRRNELIKELIAGYKQRDPKSTDIFQMLLDTILDAGPPKPLDTGKLVRMVEDHDGRYRYLSFYCGWFLKNHGQIDAAKHLLERVATSPDMWGGFRCLSEVAIKEMVSK